MKRKKQRIRPNNNEMIDRQTLDEWVGIVRLHNLGLLSDIPDVYIERYLIEEYKRKMIFTKEDVINKVDVWDIIVSKDMSDGIISNENHKQEKENKPEFEKSINEIVNEICNEKRKE